MPKKTYTIPYQYTVFAYATVLANSLDEAVELVQMDAPCPDPADIETSEDPDIVKINFSYLEGSCEVINDDLEIHNEIE